MTTANGITNEVFSELAPRQQAPRGNGTEALGQDVFLKLLVTQMSNQNPLEPQDNSEFVAQLAQFSSVEGIDKLNQNVSSLATSFQSSQALQATSLVGRQVRVQSDSALLTSDNNYVVGTIDLPNRAKTLTMNIYDSKDNLVANQVMNDVDVGEMQFAWDGSGLDGERLPPGEYRFEVISKSGDLTEQLPTSMNANVDSVTIGTGGRVLLNVAGVGEISLGKVEKIL